MAAIGVLSIGACASASAQTWNGRLNGAQAYIYDISKPVRVALVNNMSSLLPSGDREISTMARHYNALVVNLNLDWAAPDASAKRVLDALKAGTQTFPAHPELQHLNVVLFGYSAGAAGAAITASSPLLSNPDSTKAPQRVLAVVAYNELDQGPYLPPPSVPFLFLSDPGDFYGGLRTNVEDLQPPMTHDAFARLLAAQGRPITVVSQLGNWHGGSTYGWQHLLSGRFLRFWVEEVLKIGLPASAPTAGPALAPDWRTYSGAWRGTYDVVINTGVQPWGNNERMSNVVIAAQNAYQDPRPFTWLPSQDIAKKWKTLASTGSTPPEVPSSSPTFALVGFVRQGADAGSATAIDTPITATENATPAVPTSTSACGFSASGDANLIVHFDRAIASADAVATGAFLSGPVRTWSNVVIVPLKRTVFSPLMNVQLTNITPTDGGPTTTISIAAKYKEPCP